MASAPMETEIIAEDKYAMKIFIKPLSAEAYNDYADHSTFHQGDSGYDLFAQSRITVRPHTTEFLKFQISCEAKRYDGTATSYFLLPRSSISKTPLIMNNSMGLIDAEYRGEIMAPVHNLSDFDYIIEKGTRLFQLVNPLGGTINATIVNDLSDTVRGSGGFGSSGV